MKSPRHHLTVADAAKRMGHGPRWVKDRIKHGELEGFRWSPTNLTVSLESIVAYEDRRRICHLSAGPSVPGGEQSAA